MGTRSRIAIHNADGTYTSIYCHWDGYPAYVGKTLIEHYSTEDKVRALIALGDLSSLAENIGEKHDFGDRTHSDWCLAYGRDRGETGIEPKTSATLENLSALTQDCGGEWLYVFDRGAWLCAKGGVGYFGMPASDKPGALKPVGDWLKQEEASW